MVVIIAADATIKLHPSNTQPIPDVIATFAERAEVDEWLAYVLPGGLILVFVLEESLS